MAKIADGHAVIHSVTLLGEHCDVTVMRTSKSVFVAHGEFKGKLIETKAGSRTGALGRWRQRALRSED